METRTITAKGMTDALQKTRRVLGPDALIISARDLDDDSGLVEVTAVAPQEMREKTEPKAKAEQRVETHPSSDPEPWLKSIIPLREDLAGLRRMVRELRRVADEAILPGFNDLRTLILEASREQEAGRFLGPLYCELTDCGVMPDLARNLITTVEMELGLKEASRHDWLALARSLLAELLQREIKVAGPLVPGDRARIFAFVGPSGAGKTTTMAKIASRMTLSEGLDVVMITTDSYRVGSVDQARRYAELIGIPLVVADRPETMARALLSYAGVDVLLVDTPGRAFEDGEVRGSLRSILDSAHEPVETHLLMAAAYSPVQQAEFHSRFESFVPRSVIITKVDEATQPGGLLNVQHLTNLPVSYLATGQRVPEDIEVAKPSRLVQMVLGGRID